MSILLWILLVLALLVVALLIYGAMQPPSFSVVRTQDMKATPVAIYNQLSDFKNWAGWSPWEKLDPNMQKTYSGAASGVGAKYAWVGNKQVGEGNMEITHADFGKRVQLDLHFMKPFVADNVTEFTLTPSNSSTNVKWEMRGVRPFMFRVVGLFMNMDKMVGGDFEKGLAALKAVVEK